MSKTNAQLAKELKAAQAQLKAAQQENENLRNRPARARYAGGLWDNTNRRTERDPAWQGTIRIVVPPEKQAGDYVWIDVSEWQYDPETSPVKYAQNAPTFSLSLSPCPPDREAELEARRIKALGERA